MPTNTNSEGQRAAHAKDRASYTRS